MTKYAVLGHQVHTFKGQFPTQAWFEAPLGAEPIAAIPHNNESLAILACSPVGAPDVQYPLIILPGDGAGAELPIGIRPGLYIGAVMLMGEEGRFQALVFRSHPWPESRSQAEAMHRISMPAEGEA